MSKPLLAGLSPENLIDRLEGLFAVIVAESYLGEDVTIGDHMLQCAALAQAEGAPEALVAAALLHDIGYYLDAAPDNENETRPARRHDVAAGRPLGRRRQDRRGGCSRFRPLPAPAGTPGRPGASGWLTAAAAPARLRPVMSFRPASRLAPFRAGLAAACTLLLGGTAAALDCPSGSQAVDVMIENRSGAPVAVSLRQDRSQDAWATLQAQGSAWHRFHQRAAVDGLQGQLHEVPVVGP